MKGKNSSKVSSQSVVQNVGLSIGKEFLPWTLEDLHLLIFQNGVTCCPGQWLSALATY